MLDFFLLACFLSDQIIPCQKEFNVAYCILRKSHLLYLNHGLNIVGGYLFISQVSADYLNSIQFEHLSVFTQRFPEF